MANLHSVLCISIFYYAISANKHQRQNIRKLKVSSQHRSIWSYFFSFSYSQCRATTLMRDSKLNNVVFLVNEQNHSEKRNNYAHFPQVWAQAQQFRTAFADRLWFKYPSLHDKSIYFKTWHFPITQGLPMRVHATGSKEPRTEQYMNKDYR